MRLKTLDYQTAQPAAFAWRRALLLVFCFGPLTGALVGFAQANAACLCWVCHGKPDPYDMNTAAEEMDRGNVAFAGGVVGVGYGLALWLFEIVARRRIRFAIAIPVVTALGFAIAAIVFSIEFRRGTFQWFGMSEAIALLVGLVVSPLISRK